MTRDTIKSICWQAHKDGLTVDQAWRAAEARFSDRLVHRDYVARLYKLFKDGEKVAAAFAELLSKSRKQPI